MLWTKLPNELALAWRVQTAISLQHIYRRLMNIFGLMSNAKNTLTMRFSLYLRGSLQGPHVDILIAVIRQSMAAPCTFKHYTALQKPWVAQIPNMSLNADYSHLKMGHVMKMDGKWPQESWFSRDMLHTTQKCDHTKLFHKISVLFILAYPVCFARCSSSIGPWISFFTLEWKHGVRFQFFHVIYINISI